jgi:hypothetical protein
MHGRAKNSKRSPWNTFTAVRSKGLAGQEAAAATRIRTATRTAFSNLIDAAIEEDVSFILIAGDLYDGDWRDYQTHATSRIRRPRAGASPRRSPAGGAFADRPHAPLCSDPEILGALRRRPDLRRAGRRCGQFPMCGVPTTIADGRTTLRRDAVSSPADEKYVGQREPIALRFRRKIQLGHPQEDLRKQAPTPHIRAFEVKPRRSGGAVGLKAASANRLGRPGRGEIRGRFPIQGRRQKALTP